MRHSSTSPVTEYMRYGLNPRNPCRSICCSKWSAVIEGCTSIKPPESGSGLISPASLQKRVLKLEERGAPFDIEFVYLGRNFRYDDATNDPEFRAWLDRLPTNRLFQAWLPAEGPQPCLH